MPSVTCQGSLVAGLLITFLPTLAVLGLLSVWLTVLAGYRHLGKTRHFTQTRYSALKGISQNLDNGSKNSENQKKDGVRPKMAQKYQIV